jgi:hypothetical protein
MDGDDDDGGGSGGESSLLNRVVRGRLREATAAAVVSIPVDNVVDLISGLFRRRLFTTLCGML